MQSTLDQLKAIEILSAAHVQKLHDTINSTYQSASSKERALIFAQNIHQVIDHALLPLDSLNQDVIKRQLILDVINKEIFTINAYDIFYICSELEYTKDNEIDTLTNWVNGLQAQRFTKEQVSQLITLITTSPFTLSPPTPTALSNSSRLKEWMQRVIEFFSCKWEYILLSFSIVCLFSAIIFNTVYLSNSALNIDFVNHLPINSLELPICVTLHQKANGLPALLQYKAVDNNALQEWLYKRNSLLADEPYFGEIMETAKDFNINPLLLFAITGQEQGFVPKHHEQAAQIASNPFNVYGSWKDYNTSIEDSARIAATTIIHLCQDCPSDIDPIEWLNREYAEDPYWHEGVSALLTQLEKVALSQ